jgi:CRP/FNR family transcriptional regulator, cyclic AMP receptor protein
MTIRKDVYSQHVHMIDQGKIIFSEGDPATEMYIIIKGEVEISKRTSLETSKTLIVLKEGDIFGEMAIIEKKTRSATAIAVVSTKLLALDETLFFSMIERNSDFAVKVVRILSERIRRANSLIQALSSTNREALIMSGLKEFAIVHSTDSIKGRRVNKEKFILWATNHIGFPEKDIQEGLGRLTTKGTLSLGALPGEIVIPKGK